MKHLLVSGFVLLGLTIHGYTQTRPSATVSSGNSGTFTCPACQQLNVDQAWDADASTQATLDITSAILGGNAYVVYEFVQPVDLNDKLTITFAYGGAGFLSGLIANQVFEYLSVELQNSSGTEIVTYDDTNRATVELVDASSNQFAIQIINPSATTQRVKITVGAFLSVLNRELYIYDIVHNEATFDFVTTGLETGYNQAGSIVNITLCAGCTVENQEHATLTHDPNSEYTRMVAPISVSLGVDFLFNRYSWGGTTFSGLDYDFYLTLAPESFVSASTELFDNDQMAVVLAYTDNTTDTFSVSSNSSLVEVDALYSGSDKFYIKIDADDTKTVDSLEVQLYRPLTGGTRLLAPMASSDNEMQVYNVHAAESENAPLPVDLLHFTAEAGLNQIHLYWATASEQENDYFIVERSTDARSFYPLGQVPGNGTQYEMHRYEFMDTSSPVGWVYYRLTQVDYNGQAEQFPIISAFYAPANEILTLRPIPQEDQMEVRFVKNLIPDHQKAFLSLCDQQGRVLWQSHQALETYQVVRLPNYLEPGIYMFSVATPDFYLAQKCLWSE